MFPYAQRIKEHKWTRVAKEKKRKWRQAVEKTTRTLINEFSGRERERERVRESRRKLFLGGTGIEEGSRSQPRSGRQPTAMQLRDLSVRRWALNSVVSGYNNTPNESHQINHITIPPSLLLHPLNLKRSQMITICLSVFFSLSFSLALPSASPPPTSLSSIGLNLILEVKKKESSAEEGGGRKKNKKN